MAQNTKAIEAQVSWTHWSAVYSLYHARAEKPDLMELIQTMRSWNREQLETLNEESDVEFQCARYVVGSEVGAWQARYYTQTSSEEQSILARHIALNGSSPMYLFFIESNPKEMYRSEFRDFLLRVLRKAT